MSTTTHLGSAPRVGAAVMTGEEVRVALAQLIARVALALPMMYHGAGILFGWNGPGLQAFVRMGHFPLPIAVLIGAGEFFGGLGVLTGVLARLAAASTALIMAGAVVLVHLKNGYALMSQHGHGQGYEYALALLLISLAIAIGGPGRFSLTALLKKDAAPTVG